jgi:hypothetical protein
MDSPAEHFCANLRKLRAEADLTQEVTSVKLVGALGVTVGDLTAGISWTPSEDEHCAFAVDVRKGRDATRET